MAIMYILIEIDQTLDNLITNQELLKKNSNNQELLLELEALNKTQESLKSHLDYLIESFNHLRIQFAKIPYGEIKNTIYNKLIALKNISNYPLKEHLLTFRPHIIRLRKNRLKKNTFASR